MASRKPHKMPIQRIRNRQRKARKPRPASFASAQSNDFGDPAEHGQRDLIASAQGESSLVSYNPRLLNRSRMQLQFGDWQKLADIDGHELEHNPAAAELQLLAAAGHLQKGGEKAIGRARTLINSAIEAGLARESVARILIAGVGNTLGRIAALTGHSDGRVLRCFHTALSVSDPAADMELMLHPMAARQLMTLAAETGSHSVKKTAQRVAADMVYFGSSAYGQPAAASSTEGDAVAIGRDSWRLKGGAFSDITPDNERLHKSRQELHDYWRSSQQPPLVYAVANKERSVRLVELVQQYVRSGRILEIGTNVGRNLHYLHAAGFTNLEGIEISPSAVAMLRDAFPELSNIAIHVSAVEDIIGGFSDKSFECVFTMAVLEHLHHDSEWIFAHMARIARCIITVEDELRSGERHFARNYERIFTRYGMRQVHLEGREKFGMPTGFAARVFRELSR